MLMGWERRDRFLVLGRNLLSMTSEYSSKLSSENHGVMLLKTLIDITYSTTLYNQRQGSIIPWSRSPFEELPKPPEPPKEKIVCTS